MVEKVGRNDPCPCGSGLKYKQCHGKATITPPVLYIHPVKQDVDFYVQNLANRQVQMGRPYGLMPLGLPAIVNVLRDNDIDVLGISYALETMQDKSFDLRAWLRRHMTARVILIDMHWYEHTYGAISMAKVCKEILPQTWVVLGGLSASGFAHDILENFEAVDFIVRGDAEKPLLDLVKHLLTLRKGDVVGDVSSIPNLCYRVDDRIMENPLDYCAATEELDELNYADIDFLQHHDQYLVHEYIVRDLDRARAAMDEGTFRGRWIATARGCKYECSYCGGCRTAHQRLAGREGIIPRSPSFVVDEIQRLAANKVLQVSLSYDIAEMGESYWRKFFSLLRKSGVKISLYNEFFQMPTTGFLKDMARSVDMEHTVIALSPLSGNERVRRLNGKHYDNDALLNILDYLNLYNYSIFVYFSLNLPGETEHTMQETIELANTIYDRYPPSMLKILTSCHSLDPLSPMEQHPEKFGIKVTMHTFMDFYNYCKETQLASPDARTGVWRGFEVPGDSDKVRSLAKMADMWDAARKGKESSWWPVPPSW
jgi:tRNA A37 methylthiotransferase MiaB